MAFMGRSGEVGDELGSRVVASRLVREIMRLSFLMERKYAPYSKWLGTAFSRLEIAKNLESLLLETLSKDSWKERQAPLARAYTILAEKYNSLGLTKVMPTGVIYYYTRPFLVPEGNFADELQAVIQSEEIQRIKVEIGGIDQFIDNTDFLENPGLCHKAREFYQI